MFFSKIKANDNYFEKTILVLLKEKIIYKYVDCDFLLDEITPSDQQIAQSDLLVGQIIRKKILVFFLFLIE